MKPVLDPDIELSELARTVRELRNQGYTIISAGLITVTHREKGYSIDRNTVAKRLSKGVQMELEKAYPLISMHPFSSYYEKERPAFKGKDVGLCRIPPQSKWEDDLVAEAILCLAMGKKTEGVRFPDNGKLDFLFRVWRQNVNNSAMGKLFYSAHKTAIGYVNGLIPKREALHIMVSALVAIREGIDGYPKLASELKTIEAKVHDIYRGEWERNFNKTQKGKWRM